MYIIHQNEKELETKESGKMCLVTSTQVPYCYIYIFHNNNIYQLFQKPFNISCWFWSLMQFN